jgi:hypothetical protein
MNSNQAEIKVKKSYTVKNEKHQKLSKINSANFGGNFSVIILSISKDGHVALKSASPQVFFGCAATHT